LRLAVLTLRNALRKSASLQRPLLKYAQAFMIQATHTAIANARGSLEQRLARLVLMAQDRMKGTDIPLTHEFLSLMLAVRGPGVTEALHELSNIGLIGHRRGVIVVINREGLIECANDLYGTPESE
jgi:CRP-like cAMP-binding protein